jgi:hypothetical protein
MGPQIDHPSRHEEDQLDKGVVEHMQNWCPRPPGRFSPLRRPCMATPTRIKPISEDMDEQGQESAFRTT